MRGKEDWRESRRGKDKDNREKIRGGEEMGVYGEDIKGEERGKM